MSYRILCAYDGSPSAERAYEFAAGLAKRFEGMLHVIAVVQPPEMAGPDDGHALLEAGKAQFAHSFDQLRKHKAAAGLEIAFEVAVGYPVQQVLHRAQGLDVHHIVTGRRGMSALDRWSHGSVSQRIFMHAKSSVTVVA